MGIEPDIDAFDWHAALAALEWQVDLGVSDVIGDTPVNRYDLPDKPDAPILAPALPVRATPTAPVVAPSAEALTATAVAEAQRAASAAPDLPALQQAIAAYDHCELKKGARNLVFADGNPAADLMVVGEAPGRDEDYEGRPFVGAAGQLLDKMLAAIGRSRSDADPDKSVYITNVMPWRPPGNAEPTPEDIAMMQPFLLRHIALVAPKVIIATGNTSCTALLGQRGILRLRGTWAMAQGIPVMPITHPAYLLRTPAAKREAWAALLAVQAKLKAAP